jgi:hypothetical protein
MLGIEVIQYDLDQAIGVASVRCVMGNQADWTRDAAWLIERRHGRRRPTARIDQIGPPPISDLSSFPLWPSVQLSSVFLLL